MIYLEELKPVKEMVKKALREFNAECDNVKKIEESKNKTPSDIFGAAVDRMLSASKNLANTIAYIKDYYGCEIQPVMNCHSRYSSYMVVWEEEI